MQLLVARSRNKTTGPKILLNNFQLAILFLVPSFLQIISVTAKLTCHQCDGISCLRTSYEATQNCFNDLDICVNVFDGQTLLAQGCWEQLPEELRYKCESDAQNQNSGKSSGCFKCNDNLCNKMSSSSFECIQCDSENNKDCLSAPLSLLPSKCGIARTPNQYCFAKRDGARVTRGCAYDLQEQMSCLGSANCMICQPSELRFCNNIELELDESGADHEHTEDGGSDGDLEQSNERVCHQCSGINCLRTSYAGTQKCLNNVDICVTVFDDQTVLAQGCWEQLSEEVRERCNDGTECQKCNENLCNNVAAASFECLQCDSNNDESCRTNPLALLPSRCDISRAPNGYCYVKQEGDRVTRGCSYTLEEQISCLSSDSCMICLPSEIKGCNNIEVAKEDTSGSDEGSNSGLNENTTENDGSNGGSDDGNSDGANTEQTPPGGQENDVNKPSSTERPNNNNNDAGSSDPGHQGSENGGTSTSSFTIFVLVNMALVFLVK